ncbi:MAG TPA: isochorismatase family cysteine hydrolase [Candidatus Sulfotelmatobacter sp.]|jgi:nicotinamidase-related amidase|nr:isochorismatase family cysteine hydrolase [Candidatus Sulfotelmatobacter sp.]
MSDSVRLALPELDEHIRPDLDSAALLTIDVQRDFLDDGPFCFPGTSAVLPTIAKLLHAFRGTGKPIVHVVRLYEKDGSDAERCRRTLFTSSGAPAVAGSEGSQLAAELLPDTAVRLDADLLRSGGAQEVGPREVVVYKPRWGAFYRTSLERHLTSMAISTLIFTGCNFPNCPRTSIYEASERDFRLVLVSDALSVFDDRAAHEMLAIGAVVATADELLALLDGDSRPSPLPRRAGITTL